MSSNVAMFAGICIISHDIEYQTAENAGGAVVPTEAQGGRGQTSCTKYFRPFCYASNSLFASSYLILLSHVAF